MTRFMPARLVIISTLFTFLFSDFVSSQTPGAATQNEPSQQVPGMPVIHHDPVECVVENVHPLFQASVQAQGGLHTVKIYFHAKYLSDFYYVEMADTGDGWQASLPIAAPETSGFVYYIEAVDLSFNTSRTAESRPKSPTRMNVIEETRGRPQSRSGALPPAALPCPKASSPRESRGSSPPPAPVGRWTEESE